MYNESEYLLAKEMVATSDDNSDMEEPNTLHTHAHCSHYLAGTRDGPVLSAGTFSRGALLWTAQLPFPGTWVLH